jgi:hypothetical protein
MLIILKKKASNEELQKISEDFGSYIKVVADIEKGIIIAGGKRHVEGEQKLLETGSKQKDLWGGGVELDTKEIDYNSIINLRPGEDNPSRDIMSHEIREKFDNLVKKYIL